MFELNWQFLSYFNVYATLSLGLTNASVIELPSEEGEQPS